MDAFLMGFSDELEKLGASRDDEREMRRALRKARKASSSTGSDTKLDRGSRSKNYMAATTLGAIAAPLLGMASRKAGRSLHNAAVRKAIKGAKSSSKRKTLRKQLEQGPWVGSGIPKPRPGMDPLMTTSDLGGQAVRGALYGSVLQMLKDRYTDKQGKK